LKRAKQAGAHPVGGWPSLSPSISGWRVAQPFDFADITNKEGGRVAQAFHLAGITREAGAPFLRVLCEGAGTPKPAPAKLRFRPRNEIFISRHQ
jgi:hypothetical protein